MHKKLPIIILGGADAQSGPKPQGMRAHDVLAGAKGLLELPNGRILAEELAVRLEQSECFFAPIIVGPNAAYQSRVQHRVVDVQGNLFDTLARIRKLLYDEFDAKTPVAFISCDVLPTSDEIGRLMQDCYYPAEDSVFWLQLVRADASEMGASAWKPRYLFRPKKNQPLASYYPGHLVILRPAALRLRLTNHLLGHAYAQRNRPLWLRALLLPALGLGRLVIEDLRGITLGKLPSLALLIPYVGLSSLFKFWRGRLTVSGFAHGVQKMFVHRNWQHHNNGQAVVVASTDIRAFAKDIDTKIEFDELLQTFKAPAGSYTASEPQELTVLSLNLAHGRSESAHQLFLGDDKIRANLDKIVEVIKREAPLMVALQEADAASVWNGKFNHVDYLARGASFDHYYLGSHMRRLKLDYGTALLSQIRLENVQSVSFKSTPMLPPKGFVVASVQWPRLGTLDVVSLHLDFLRARARLEQVDSIIETLRHRDNPRIIMGDFNCEWHSKDSALRRIAHALELQVHKPESKNLGTFRARNTRWDWVLTSNCFEVLSYRTLLDTLSDHSPVLARLRLR